MFITGMIVNSPPATQQLHGLHLRVIEEIWHFDPSIYLRGRFVGVVLKAIRDDRFYSFIISDGTSTAEVSLSYRKPEVELELPVKGESVQVVGHGYRKVLGGAKNSYSFLKIYASSISAITVEQQMLLSVQAGLGRRNREKERRGGQVSLVAVQVKRAATECDLLQTRTLVLVYCYYIFELNSDISTYIFNPEMVRCSKNGKEFMQNNTLPKLVLETALKKVLEEFAVAGLLTLKQQEGKDFYVIKRELLGAIEKTFAEKIEEEGQRGGVCIEPLTQYVNRKLAEFTKTSFQLFNWRFSQKVLTKLQGINKIYKTADKRIFPNTL